MSNVTLSGRLAHINEAALRLAAASRLLASAEPEDADLLIAAASLATQARDEILEAADR